MTQGRHSTIASIAPIPREEIELHGLVVAYRTNSPGPIAHRWIPNRENNGSMFHP